MALPATDDFNRADDTTLGPNWSVVGNAFGIASNKANFQDGAAGTGTQEGLVRWIADAVGDDQYAQAIVSGFGFLGMLGPAVRVSGVWGSVNANAYFYFGRNSPDSGGISKFVNNVETQIATGLSGFVNADLLRIEAEGTTIRAYKNGVQHGIDITDASIASGSFGLYAYTDCPPTGTYEDFEGGELGGAGTFNAAWARGANVLLQPGL